MKLHYLGPIGSYSHIAADGWSSAQSEVMELVAEKNFVEIFASVASDNDLGILPIENSITSNVHENIDRIFSKKFGIIGEISLHINLHLLSLGNAELSTITTVISHPKALEQVQRIVKKSGWDVVVASSTAQAAEQVDAAAEPHQAAIGSRALLMYYPSLKVLQEDIGDVKNNYTRFLIIGMRPKELYAPNHNKATYVFTVPHVPSALVQVLAPLGAAGINMTKIESRPIPTEPGNYSFWIDITSDTSTDLKNAEKIMAQFCLTYDLLGTYQSAQTYES